MSENLSEEKIRIAAPKDPEIGADTSKAFLYDLIDAAQVGSIDISSIDALSQSAQTREQTYQLLDTMAQDEVIASVLSTYAGDTVQTNDKGDVVWIESDDPLVLDYTTWLLDSLNIGKELYKWAYCLVTYGDVYVRLYRESDRKADTLFKESDKQRRLNEAISSHGTISEDTKLRVYDSNDRYIPYVRMVDNPGEMFDLQKFGKTYGYIKAPITYMQKTSDELYNYLTRYKTKQSDVEIFDAMSFVHGCIETTNQRQPETVDIYLDSADIEEEDSMTNSYSVRRGQSILYNVFRIWRELSLLEMSALLNRLTRSSLVRILNIDTGDMPKEQVRRFIDRLKEKIEQKTALNVDKQTSQYTNPGPIENTIYVPTHGTQGNISVQSIGGDFDPKSLVDLEYFRDKLFGGLRVPKQFFGFCEDGAGFNGGTSLTILSAEYGKAIKSIQHILCQVVTDIINLFLIDRGLDNYVYKFTVRMQEPVTQEELDKRANTETRLRYVSDMMNQLAEIDDKVTKLKIYKSLVSNIVNDTEVISYLDDYIKKLENGNTGGATNPDAEPAGDSFNDLFGAGDQSMDISPQAEPQAETSEPAAAETPESSSPDLNIPNEAFTDNTNKDMINEDAIDGEESENDDSYLPSAADLGIDLTQKYEVDED